jgi:monoamine oxidase
MARTDLLHRFQCLYRDFKEADSSGRTVQQVQSARLTRKPTRREFLSGGATLTAAAVAAVSGSRLALGASPPRIVIVGGGIAGLNAALTLQDAGYPATIYEASSRLGGRMHSDTTSWANGQVSEHCGEFIDSGHKTILGLAKRFKISVADLSSAEPPQSTETYYFFGKRYTLEQANADFNPVYQAVKKDLLAAGFPTVYYSYTAAAAALDHTSVYDWIENHVPGGHGSMMGQLLDIGYNVEYGAETTELSALDLIYLLGYQSVPGNFHLYGSSDERYHLAGGNEQLPRAIAAALPAGSIHTGTALTAIARNSNGTFTLTFKNPTKLTVVADRVILALPFSVLRKLDYSKAGFNAVKTTGIEQIGYGNSVKLHLQFKNRLWNQSGPWGISNGYSLADTGYQSTWDVTRAQSGNTGILVDFTGGNVAANFGGNPALVQSYATNFLGELDPVFPGITLQWNGIATLDVPTLDPNLRGSYSHWKVGQYTLFSGSERERSGNCHFAGEHCSLQFQGFMEGGAQEGQRAANEILADYKAGVYP